MSFLEYCSLFCRRQQKVERTLRLHAPNGRMLILVFSVLIFYLMVGEVLVRASDSYSTFGIPSIGSNYREFEARLSEFETYAADRATIDCIFLGDSTAMTDFAPYMFADSFHDETSVNIECFNFGVGAFTIADSTALAQILVRDHSPELLILGVEALNFSVPADAPGDVDLAELPWTRYKLDQFTIEGLLYEHSALYRHLSAIRQLLTLQTNPAEVRRITVEAVNRTRDGFYPMYGPGPFNVASTPDPNSDHPYHENYFGALTEYKLLPEHLAALDKVVALNSPSTQVIIVEMPVPTTFFYYFGNGEQDYRKFIAAVELSVSNTTVPFWTTTDLQLFSDELWFNYNHLNARGATIFSEWLGRRLGQAVVGETVRFTAYVAETNSRRKYMK